ncbi:MAG: class I SAM-dependent rRNA methyltransferase, partial [Lachnospiraceae bacterium]|nr:class I SAM-dependent rRNA methyltransferase [Lachnospiraceae bacterium]
FEGNIVGCGFINDKSKLRIRLMSRDRYVGDDGVKHGLEIDKEFLKMRVRNAWEYRKKVMEPSDTAAGGSLRLIFGEADYLPGLTVDKFNDVLVVESLALGIEKLKLTILECIKEVLAEDGINIRGIYERSEAKERDLEGMPRVKGFIGPEFDTKVEITENGIKYIVDVKDGQKTGFFLDQKYNRKAIWKLMRPESSVLDCFTHTGSFGLNAAMAGAGSVLSVDASDLAIEQAKENVRLNGLEDKMTCEVWDVFELLPKLEEEGRKFDVVILDPPAFTKSRASIKKAVTGYKEINLRGMKLVKDGGFLISASCSHFMDPDLFADTIRKAAKDAHVRLRQVEFRTQAPDHPIAWSSDESYYLKFYIFQVVTEK